MAKRIIDMRTISKVPSRLARFQEIFAREAFRELKSIEKRAVQTMRKAVTTAPPTGAMRVPANFKNRAVRTPIGAGTPGAVATGKYRDAWKAKRISYGGSTYVIGRLQGGKRVAGGVMGVLVYNTLVYAPRVEFGRSRGKMPPIPAIRKWLQVKFGLPYRTARRLAWPIARKIMHRGIPGRAIMTAKSTQDEFMSYLETAANTAQAHALARRF